MHSFSMWALTVVRQTWYCLGVPRHDTMRVNILFKLTEITLLFLDVIWSPSSWISEHLNLNKICYTLLHKYRFAHVWTSLNRPELVIEVTVMGLLNSKWCEVTVKDGVPSFVIPFCLENNNKLYFDFTEQTLYNKKTRQLFQLIVTQHRTIRRQDNCFNSLSLIHQKRNGNTSYLCHHPQGKTSLQGRQLQKCCLHHTSCHQLLNTMYINVKFNFGM